METTEQILARAQHHCEVMGVEWTPALRSVIVNTVSPLVMEVERMTMPIAVVRGLRRFAINAPTGIARTLCGAWLADRYDDVGKVRP